jgi:hypothetical protein
MKDMLTYKVRKVVSQSQGPERVTASEAALRIERDVYLQARMIAHT